MFVLVNALEATDVSMPAAERIAHAMSHAGVSITVTSITDVLAFALGSTSQLPALSTFCAFAAIGTLSDARAVIAVATHSDAPFELAAGILADYLLQISFFAAWMALDARREASPRAIPRLIPRLSHAPAASTCLRQSRSPISPHASLLCPTRTPPAAAAACGARSTFWSRRPRADCARSSGELEASCPGVPQCWAPAHYYWRHLCWRRRRYVPCLRPLWSKIAIVAFFLGYASLSAWGASRLEQARDGT